MHILHFQYKESYQQGVQQIWNFKYTDMLHGNPLETGFAECNSSNLKRKKVRLDRREAECCGDKMLTFMSGRKE